MDRNVFMTFDEFVSINRKLLELTGLALYRSESYQHAFLRVDPSDAASWKDGGLRALALLVGDPKDEDRILGPKQADVKRAARVGFVSIQFGGEDECAFGASHYGADSSVSAKLVDRELNKLLKQFAHRGVVDCDGNPSQHFFWTDSALATGKNWHQFLGVGARKEMNSRPGFRPLPK